MKVSWWNWSRNHFISKPNKCCHWQKFHWQVSKIIFYPTRILEKNAIWNQCKHPADAFRTIFPIFFKKMSRKCSNYLDEIPLELWDQIVLDLNIEDCFNLSHSFAKTDRFQSSEYLKYKLDLYTIIQSRYLFDAVSIDRISIDRIW